jgi:hypothetical protein
MIVTLCRHEDGRPVAMIPATGKRKTARSAKRAPCSPIIPFDEERNLPSLIADYQESKRIAIELILKARPFP